MRVLSKMHVDKPLNDGLLEEVKAKMLEGLADHLNDKRLVVVEKYPSITSNGQEFRTRPIYVITENEYNTILDIICEGNRDCLDIAMAVKAILIGNIEFTSSLYPIEIIHRLCRNVEKYSSMTFDEAVNIFGSNNVPESLATTVYNLIIETANKGYSIEHINILVYHLVEKHRIDQLYKNF